MLFYGISPLFFGNMIILMCSRKLSMVFCNPIRNCSVKVFLLLFDSLHTTPAVFEVNPKSTFVLERSTKICGCSHIKKLSTSCENLDTISNFCYFLLQFYFFWKRNNCTEIRKRDYQTI